MRLSEMFSVATLNVFLALFSMIMAIVALGLLAFVIVREHYVPREIAKMQSRERIKRHESVVVDFRNPETIPDHFLQLNTLMFDKKKRGTKNNQIMQVNQGNVIQLPTMEKMAAITEDDEFSQRSRSTIGSLERMTNNNKAESISSDEAIYVNSDFSSFGSEVEYADVPTRDVPRRRESVPNEESRGVEKNEVPIRARRNTVDETTMRSIQSSTVSATEEWVVEQSTIEAPSRKVIVDLECGNEYSIC